jgi:hypothetical protein
LTFLHKKEFGGGREGFINSFLCGGREVNGTLHSFAHFSSEVFCLYNKSVPRACIMSKQCTFPFQGHAHAQLIGRKG